MFGKLTEKVSTSLPIEAVEDMDRKARTFGMDRATFIRETLLIAVYGRDGVVSMYAEQVARMVGSGPKQEQA